MNFFQTIITWVGGFLAMGAVAMSLFGIGAVILDEGRRPGTDITRDNKLILKGCIILLFIAMIIAFVAGLMERFAG